MLRIIRHAIEHRPHRIEGAIVGKQLPAQAESGIVEDRRRVRQCQVGRGAIGRMQQIGGRLHREEFRIDRIDAGQQRQAIIEETLLHPGVEDARRRHRHLDVGNAHQAAGMRIRAVAAIVDHVEIGDGVLPAEQTIEVGAQLEVEVPHVAGGGTAALVPLQYIDLVAGLEMQALLPGFRTRAAPVAGKGRGREIGRVVRKRTARHARQQ